MLSESDKERIRSEEAFRLEVRDTLQPPKRPLSAKGKIWQGMNSAFGIWFLSTVAVSVIASGVTWYEEKLKKGHLQQITIQKLYTEASFRIRRFDEDTKAIEDSYNRPPLSNLEIVPATQVGKVLESLKGVDTDGIFSEYSSRSLRSLLWELKGVVDSHKGKFVANAFDSSLALSRIEREWKGLIERSQPEDQSWKHADFLEKLKTLRGSILPGLNKINALDPKTITITYD